MRDLATIFATAIASIDPTTAADHMREAVAAHERKAWLPAPRPQRPTETERWATCYHETGHAVAAYLGGHEILELRVRDDDGSGHCRVSDFGTDHRAHIRFLLAGPAAEVRYRPGAIHRYADGQCFDFLKARSLIDTVNLPGDWPPLSYRAAAADAMAFVEQHWRAIQNVSTALHDAAELDHHAVAVFAGCDYRG